MHKAMQNVAIARGGLTCLRVNQGYRQHNHSIERIQLPIRIW